MPRPITRAQALQNDRFIERLTLSGNVRLAAREVGVKYSTIQHRRSKHAGFAQAWDAAIAVAHARFHLGGGRRGPEPSAPSRLRVNSLDCARDERGLRTLGGEAMVVRTKNGTLQLRPACRDRLTKAGEQAFLLALSATANVTLSAAAAGASPAAFYRRRKKSPAFNREFRLALQMGYDRLEAAALMAALPESHADDAWRHNASPPIPPMSQDQAMQLLFLHQKSVRQGWSEPHRRRRRNESDAQYRMRLFLMWKAEQRQIAEEQAVARAARFEETGDWRMAGEEAPIELPPLHLVTGWSKADPRKVKHDPEVALFGGWRIGDMKRKLGEKK